jgi:DnaA-homolog protein
LRNLLKEKAYLKDWPKFDAVLIDDIEYLNPELQAGMCHQFNELQSSGTTLIVTSSAPPAALDFNLPDLKSRMESGLSLKIESLKEDELKTALMMHAKHMGLALDEKIYEFLLKRLERNLGTLTQSLKKIADYSLIARRPVTTAMIKEVLGL